MRHEARLMLSMLGLLDTSPPEKARRSAKRRSRDRARAKAAKQARKRNRR